MNFRRLSLQDITSTEDIMKETRSERILFDAVRQHDISLDA